MRAVIARGTGRRPLGGAVLCVLLLAGVVAPRITVEVHHHGGGDHGHLHLAPTAAHDHHDSGDVRSGHDHHNEAHASSPRATHGDHSHAHEHAHAPAARSDPPEDGTRLANAEDADHVHAYDPYHRSLKPEPVRAPAPGTTAWISRPAASDPQIDRASAPRARGPPLTTSESDSTSYS